MYTNIFQTYKIPSVCRAGGRRPGPEAPLLLDPDRSAGRLAVVYSLLEGLVAVHCQFIEYVCMQIQYVRI